MTDQYKKASASRRAGLRDVSPNDVSKEEKKASPGGYGDDQGTRIGSPTPRDREYTGPSSHPVKEGLEGAIFDNEDDNNPPSPPSHRTRRPE